jgi:LysM repeat protein
MKRAIVFVLFLLTACGPATATPAPTPTPPMLNLQTRIAATLAAIPTASNLTPRSPTSTPQVAQPSATEPAQATVTPDPATSASEYTVQPGDTLSIIAVRFNTSMAAIQLLNNIDDARLVRAGQQLKIPTAKLAPDENPFWIVYVVQPNETFSAIALRFGVQLEALLRVNAITNAALVQAGQRLIIPLRAPA